MNMNSELRKLKTKDVYSLILFILYKLKEDPKYSTLSELAYILDKDSLLNLCQYYGGLTITIPTISEIDHVLNALLIYQKVQLDGLDLNAVVNSIDLRQNEKEQIVDLYKSIINIMGKYSIS